MSNIVPFNEMQSMALSVAKSGMFGLKNPEQAVTLMLIAQAEGIHPIQAIQQYSIINGLPALKTTEMVARYMRSGGKIVWMETSAKVAKAKFIYDGNELVYEYTIEDAKLAGLTNKDNWRRMPKEMLRARCSSAGIRMSNPTCLNNFYSVEEMQDTPQDNLPRFDYVPTEEVYTDAEIEPTVNELKTVLAKALTELGFNKAMIKEFAELYKLNEDESLLLDMATNKETLLEAVKKFEDG